MSVIDWVRRRVCGCVCHGGFPVCECVISRAFACWCCARGGQCIDLETVDSIVADVFEKFDEGSKGHLSKDDFAKWMKSQPEIDEVCTVTRTLIARCALLCRPSSTWLMHVCSPRTALCIGVSSGPLNAATPSTSSPTASRSHVNTTEHFQWWWWWWW